MVSGGALSLRYNNCGWFGSDAGVDLSAKTYLVIRVKGAAGGEQDIRIPMAANGVNRNSPSQLAMGFWYGGASTITIDEIRFE